MFTAHEHEQLDYILERAGNAIAASIVTRFEDSLQLPARIPPADASTIPPRTDPRIPHAVTSTTPPRTDTSIPPAETSTTPI